MPDNSARIGGGTAAGCSQSPTVDLERAASTIVATTDDRTVVVLGSTAASRSQAPAVQRDGATATVAAAADDRAGIVARAAAFSFDAAAVNGDRSGGFTLVTADDGLRTVVGVNRAASRGDFSASSSLPVNGEAAIRGHVDAAVDGETSVVRQD